jgi:myo-inositol 2-dehydrogenase / D-chiro-inositol 1-dehydrogenase
MSHVSRRAFLKRTAAATLVAGFPLILPSRLLGQQAPSKRLNIGLIGCGRICSMEITGLMGEKDRARFVAVCDVDSRRMAEVKRRIERNYADQEIESSIKAYDDYRELIADPSIDAVMITVPDHWHALMIAEAALAGKDIWVQKPMTMTVAEGRAVSDLVRAKGRVLQVATQQRSSRFFHQASELVRNGAIGKIHTVRIGLGSDAPGGRNEPTPVPEGLNYDMWLGPTPEAPYIEDRVHPQANSSRPGWMRYSTHCHGMITNWGSHHIDILHWALGMEDSGPTRVEATARFPEPDSGLWNVHLDYDVNLDFASGARAHICNKYTTGLRFEGEDGWIWVSRDTGRSKASDPSVPPDTVLPAITASDRDILRAPTDQFTVRLPRARDMVSNWIDAIHSREQPIASVEVGHRSNTSCMISRIAMNIPRPLVWDAATESFVGDDEANAMRARKDRDGYSLAQLLRRSGYADLAKSSGLDAAG